MESWPDVFSPVVYSDSVWEDVRAYTWIHEMLRSSGLIQLSVHLYFYLWWRLCTVWISISAMWIIRKLECIPAILCWYGHMFLPFIIVEIVLFGGLICMIIIIKSFILTPSGASLFCSCPVPCSAKFEKWLCQLWRRCWYEVQLQKHLQLQLWPRLPFSGSQ